MLRVGCLKVQKDCLEAVPDCILFEYKQCDECLLFSFVINLTRDPWSCMCLFRSSF